MIWGVVDAIEAGHIAACQDISDGGLAVALGEMALGGFGKGKLGVSVTVPSEMLGEFRGDKWLFSESSGFVMEVRAGHEQQVQEIFAGYGLELMELGAVNSEARFQITAGPVAVDLPLDGVRDAWTNGLAAVLR